ncbi:response regulator transcription factor [Streptomyces sp. NPDC029674]|uniref:response regulator transcription factor n=1 Tax=Streptomyces sp. NPDC029674 TaxID=3365297 RepID=UPI00384E99B5
MTITATSPVRYSPRPQATQRPMGPRTRFPYHAALEAARHDVSIVYGPRTLGPTAIRQDKQALTGLLHRWVRVRAVWDEEALSSPHVESYLSWQAGSGIQIRTAERTEVTFALLDSRTSVVVQPTANTNGLDGAVTVSECSETTGMLHYLFHDLWENASPRRTCAHAPDDRQALDVLLLLARGYTDEQIAASLGVSKRTVSRAVTRMMQELNAQSRFEAGALAARRGWLKSIDTAARPKPGRP